MSTELDRCFQSPPNWTVFGIRIERQAAPARRWHRWGCSDGSYGVANYRTPVGAILAQRRWRKKARTLGPDGQPRGNS